VTDGVDIGFCSTLLLVDEVTGIVLRFCATVSKSFKGEAAGAAATLAVVKVKGTGVERGLVIEGIVVGAVTIVVTLGGVRIVAVVVVVVVSIGLAVTPAVENGEGAVIEEEEKGEGAGTEGVEEELE
jgi:hypothetical protein